MKASPHNLFEIATFFHPWRFHCFYPSSSKMIVFYMLFLPVLWFVSCKYVVCPRYLLLSTSSISPFNHLYIYFCCFQILSCILLFLYAFQVLFLTVTNYWIFKLLGELPTKRPLTTLIRSNFGHDRRNWLKNLPALAVDFGSFLWVSTIIKSLKTVLWVNKVKKSRKLCV